MTTAELTRTELTVTESTDIMLQAEELNVLPDRLETTGWGGCGCGGWGGGWGGWNGGWGGWNGCGGGWNGCGWGGW